MKKRVLSLLLVLCMVLTIMPAAAVFADGTPTLSVGSVTAKHGDTVEVPISISNNPGIWAIQFDLNYDKTKLEYVGKAKGDGSFATGWEIGTTAVWNYGEEEDISENGVLVKLKFKVLDKADGEVSITLSNAMAVNCSENRIDVPSASGSVTSDKYNAVVTKPTCKDQGYTTYTCPCGKSYVDNYVDADASKHVTELKNYKAATCKEEGYSGDKVCTVCGATVENGTATAKKDHQTEIKNAKEATCKEAGYSGDKVCKVCGETIEKGTVLEKTAHVAGDPVNVKEATCSAKGYTGDTYCKFCNTKMSTGTETETVPHTAGEPVNAKDATCTEVGYTGDTYCKFCNTKMSTGEEIPTKEHKSVDVAAVEPTCTEAGSKAGTKCSVCGVILTGCEEVAALGHKVVEVAAVDATCTTAGSTAGTKCSVCDKILSGCEEVKALGHSYKNGVCERCGAKKPAGHVHSYTDVVTAPTCTEKGYTTYTCVCGFSYVADYVDALGHTETVDAAVAATCEKTGLTEGKHCSVCDKVLVAQEETPALGHTEVVDAAVAATCEKTGLTEGKHCSVCDKVLAAQEVVPMAAHSYKDGVCTVCGAKEPVANPFPDVAESSPYYEAILWAYSNDITAGKLDGSFGIGDGCTRAQIVTFLYRQAGSPDVAADVKNPFTDVSEGSVYYKAIMWAVANGITKGTTETTFDPNAVCTRGQIVTFLFRASGDEKVASTVNFSDVAVGSYCYDAVAWAVANGITKGFNDTTFAPNATCTRGQAVTFIYRASK